MAEFYIKKPDYTTAQKLPSILIHIAFPLILIWDGLQFLINKVLGSFIAKKMWPSANVSESRSSVLHIDGLTSTQHTLFTHDDASLDTIEIDHYTQNSLNNDLRTFIIYFPDHNQTYESMMHEMQEDAAALKQNVIGFNYRGIQKSTGTIRSVNDLITDGLCQVARLLDSGVIPAHILLKGRGYGGAIATMVAYHYYKHHQSINLFCDRTFSSLAAVWATRIYPSYEKPQTIKEQIFSGAAFYLAKTVLSITQWDLDITRAFKEIPEANKEYIVIRTRHATKTPLTTDDLTIPHSASLHQGLKSVRQLQKITNRMINNSIYSGEYHTALTGYQDSLKKKSSARKMEAKVSDQRDKHDVPQKDLTNRYGLDALSFFRGFAKEIQSKSNNRHSGSVLKSSQKKVT